MAIYAALAGPTNIGKMKAYCGEIFGQGNL